MTPLPPPHDLWLIFLTGLFGTSHCIGMCGGLITAYSLGSSHQHPGLSPWHPRRLLPHLLYSSGRVATYVALGGIIGVAGSLVSVTGRLAGLAGLTHLLAGAVMILMGLGALGLSPGRLWRGEGAGAAPLVALGARVLRSDSPLRTLYLGLLTGLLPCSLHWAMQVKAAAAGSVPGAMASMAAFGLGTVPPLLALGSVSALLGQAARRWLLQAAGVLVLILGGMELWRGIRLAGWLVF